MPRIALATSRDLPELFHDDVPLAAALRERQARVDVAVWDEPAVDWSAYDLVLVRSTWDYTWRREEYVGWADRVEQVTRLRNPAGIVRWNTDKTYLRDLAARGVPIVPTIWLEEPADLDDVLSGQGWTEAVLKPTVSAGARNTLRFAAGATADAQELLATVTAAGTAMVQPYLHSVEDHGERSLFFFSGNHSHAVRRNPALVPGRPLTHDASPATAADDELDVARTVLDAVGADLIYARVDLVRDPAGRPVLMELEAVEPQLFLRYAPDAADRLADAVLREVG